MNLGIDTNIKIAEKYCLHPSGCPKLRGKTDYNEKLSICAGCTNYLNKIDLIELLHYYASNNNTSTTTPAPVKPKKPPKGKSTELNKSQIKKILTLHNQGFTKNKIATELTLHFTTVKNVIELGFKNDEANQKVQQVMDELKRDGLL